MIKPRQEVDMKLLIALVSVTVLISVSVFWKGVPYEQDLMCQQVKADITTAMNDMSKATATMSKANAAVSKKSAADLSKADADITTAMVDISKATADLSKATDNYSKATGDVKKYCRKNIWFFIGKMLGL